MKNIDWKKEFSYRKYSSGTDTSDATATANDIVEGKTAYVNDEKITGSLGYLKSTDTISAKYDRLSKWNTYISVYSGMIGSFADPKLFVGGNVSIPVQNKDLASALELKAEDIKKDVKILNVIGTYEGTGINWGEIGYDKTPDDITKAFEYAKEIANNWDPNVKSMHNAFYNDKKLVYFPKIDTSNVTSMQSAFENCSNLTTIPQLDTSNVTDMSSMLSYCSRLKVFPQLDTSKVTNMSSMFIGCSKLTTIPQLDTSNVTDMSNMFYINTSLTTIPQLDTSNVTNISGMFYGCSGLKVFPQLDTSNVVNAYRMVYNTPIEDYPSLDFSNVEKFDNESLRGRSSRGSVTYKGFVNYGKAFNKTETNYRYYKMNLAYYNTDIDHDSLMNVINNLYDLNLSYNVANGGTLYTQSLELGKDKSGNTNISKLTDEEIAIATSKGWTLI